MLDVDWRTISLEDLKQLVGERLSYQYGEKAKSDEYCGLYFHARATPFTLAEHDIPIRSFRATSRYSYPLFLFYNIAAGGEIEEIVKRYDNIHVMGIRHLPTIQEYDHFIIKKMFAAIDPRFNKTVTFHSDGFFLNPGWEDFVEAHDFDFVGAPWCNIPLPKMLLPHAKDKYPIKHRTAVGNGGFCYRKRDKCMEVLRRVDEADIDWRNCPDDLFYSYFGFGLEIFKMYAHELALGWSVEPFQGFSCSYGFHNTFTRMNDIIGGKVPGNRWIESLMLL